MCVSIDRGLLPETRSHCRSKEIKSVLMFSANAPKQSKERKCTLASDSESLLENRKVGALHLILNSTLLLNFLLGNVVNGEMNNNCSSAVFICRRWLDKNVFVFCFFSFPKLLNRSL